MLPERLQLPLPFPHCPGYDPRDFVAAESNREALAWLETGWPDRRLALWGPAGSGKSHLLHVWAKREAVRVLAGRALDEQTVADLEGVPQNSALALDDADAVPAEAVLLHLLNTARDRGLRVLLSARTPPSRWPVRLPDLSSRLRAITAVEIKAPGDDLLAALLMRLFADLQLNVAPHVQSWLLTRLARSAAVLRQAVTLLDQASLASGRAITREFAALVIDNGAVDEADEVPISRPDPLP